MKIFGINCDKRLSCITGELVHENLKLAPITAFRLV